MATNIDKNTRLQSRSNLWLDEREASRSGEISKITDTRNKDTLCQSLLGHIEIRSAAMTHGRIHEKLAMASFENGYVTEFHHVSFR